MAVKRLSMVEKPHRAPEDTTAPFGHVFLTTGVSWTAKAIKELSRLKREKARQNFNCICQCCDSTLTVTGWEVWENNSMIKMYHYKDFQVDDYDAVVLFEATRCPICDSKIGFGIDWKYRQNITNGMRKI